MFKIEEVSDVFVDGVVKDSTGHVLFVSLIGTDTELQALAGRLSLSASHPECLKSISFRDNNNESVGLVIPQQVEKVSQRMRAEAMMSGAHVFWFQRSLLPQYWGVGKGYLLIPTTCSEEEFDGKLWQTTKNICRPPLLDHWKSTLLEMFKDEQWLKPLPSWGRAQAYELNFPDEHVGHIESLVKENVLLKQPEGSVVCH